MEWLGWVGGVLNDHRAMEGLGWVGLEGSFQITEPWNGWVALGWKGIASPLHPKPPLPLCLSMNVGVEDATSSASITLLVQPHTTIAALKQQVRLCQLSLPCGTQRGGLRVPVLLSAMATAITVWCPASPAGIGAGSVC